jgi:hypothetical protein
MSDGGDTWDGEQVRIWLERRFVASLDEQARADKNGRGFEDDYDKAAAEEWVCRTAKTNAATSDRKLFETFLKQLLAQDEYKRTEIHDDRRFDREVRSYLRKLIKMTKTNTGSGNMSRFQ